MKLACKMLIFYLVKKLLPHSRYGILLCMGNYCIRGLFGGDFNLAVWQFFIGLLNLNHAVLTRTHKMN